MSGFRFVLLSLLMCLLARPAAADDPSGRPCVEGDNVRAMRPWIGRLLHDLVPQSPTLARLADTLHGAPVVIHLDDDLSGEDGWDGRLRFVTSAGGCRYLRIDLRNTGQPEVSGALLAHELQHAVEVARSAVTDRQGFARLFRVIGFAVGAGHTTFDTEAAIDAGRRAWAELSGRPLSHLRRP